MTPDQSQRVAIACFCIGVVLVVLAMKAVPS